mmetsp:Transcript_109378/g.316166  ORF Transcript_109378/g.316166 Transcript_109378/m.316166 type:complete len:146 (-) Transcript_109378:321-758(-)
MWMLTRLIACLALASLATGLRASVHSMAAHPVMISRWLSRRSTGPEPHQTQPEAKHEPAAKDVAKQEVAVMRRVSREELDAEIRDALQWATRVEAEYRVAREREACAQERAKGCAERAKACEESEARCRRWDAIDRVFLEDLSPY